MKWLLLASATRRGVAGAVLTLVLGLNNPAAADAPVTEEQADSIAAAAVEQDAPDMHVIQTIVVSEPDETPQWFPALSEEDLTLSRSPMLIEDFADAQKTLEHTAIPLPPAAWSGLAGLASLAALRGRKAVVRFFT